MTLRLQSIDETNRGDHWHLREEDTCLFLYEYTSRQGYSFSATNGLISNLKKKPTSSQNELYYKGKAIRSCAADLQKTLNPKWLEVATIIPIPPSKIPGHPDYDTRMEKVCQTIQPGLDVRSLVRQTMSLDADHLAADGQRKSIQDLVDVYEINEQLVAAKQVTTIGIVDDVLTNGTHYRAMEQVLKQRFPGVKITGIFVARRVFPPQANPFADLTL